MSETLEQKMAATATARVEKRVMEGNGKEYLNACEGLPALLLQCGLLATLAWLRASGQEGSKRAGEDLEHHLAMLGAEKDLMQNLRGAASADYQVYYELALRAAVWQKRLAKALITKGK